MSQAFLYASLAIVSSVLVSLFLLWGALKDHRRADRPFFWHWALGFALLSVVHAPALTVHVVRNVSYAVFLSVYIATFFIILAAAFLWYRGTILFFTADKRWLTTYPGLYATGVALLVLGLLISGASVPIILTAWMILVPLPLDLFIAAVFFWFFLSSACYEDKARRFAPLLISVSWLAFFILDAAIWNILFHFPADFWIIRLASVSKWYLARAVSHIMLLIGLFLFWRHLPSIRKIPLRGSV